MNAKVSTWKLNPKSKKLCSCCQAVAKIKVEIQTSWFRGDDDVYLACVEHQEMIKAERWDDFYHDLAMTKAKRSASTDRKEK
jgi:hypothetical protein